MHEAEGHVTVDQSEAGLLWKLGGAFVCNVVLMPIAVSLLQSWFAQGELLSQALYERTGFLAMATVIMSIQRATGDLPRALQLVTLAKRACAARAAPPATLQAVWAPPTMRVALQAAQLYWLFACALLYGPLAPFFYGLAAGYALFSFACTKFGVVFWYMRPPAITAELSGQFARMVALLMPVQLLIKLLVRRAAEPSTDAPLSLLHFVVALYLCYAALGRIVGKTAGGAGGGLLPYLFPYTFGFGGGGGGGGPYEQLTGELDTDHIRYEDVERVKGCAIDVYVNPHRRRAPGLTRQRSGFFGQEPAPPGVASSAAEAVDQNTAVLSSSLPLDSLTFDIS